MVATVYLDAFKLSLHCLTKLLSRPKIYTAKPNVAGRYDIIFCHCPQELWFDVEAAYRSLDPLVLSDEIRYGIHQCDEASCNVAFGQVLILMTVGIKLVEFYFLAGFRGHIEAQGGLSVAGGCRCLTKELDMIAC